MPLSKIHPVARLVLRTRVVAGPLVTECWEFTGTKISAGYGEMSVNGKQEYTHRVAYQAFYGPLPKGIEPDHLCCNPACWRPNHLEAVTHGENIRRAYKRRGHLPCKVGHDVSERRTSHRGDGSTFTQCKACERARYHAKKAMQDAQS